MIPMSSDVAELVGANAAAVSNRSLLYEKFPLPKEWGHARKVDDAGRWNVLRLAERGRELLATERDRLSRQAQAPRGRPENQERDRFLSGIAGRMAQFEGPDRGAFDLASANAADLLRRVQAAYGGHAVVFEAELAARLMVNMAGGVVENAGICLDRCFGMPYLPGSAVKGITRATALWAIREAPEGEKERLLALAMLIFGYVGQDWQKSGGAFAWAAGLPMARAVAERLQTPGRNDRRGSVCFLPAHPLQPPKIVVDMVNPHYPDYYSGKCPDANDNESPKPNYFPAVEAGCRYGFAAVLMREPPKAVCSAAELLGQLQTWMHHAVRRKGAGAKTGAGYGWFWLPGEDRPRIEKAPTRLATPDGGSVQLPPKLAPLAAGGIGNKDSFRVALPAMNEIADNDELRRVFEALVPVKERQRLFRRNPYWQAFSSRPDGAVILTRLGLELK